METGSDDSTEGFDSLPKYTLELDCLEAMNEESPLEHFSQFFDDDKNKAKQSIRSTVH